MTIQFKSLAAAAADGLDLAVVAGLGAPYAWITSYVAGDKIYCVHEAESAEVIARHAREGGFPANRITPVAAVIGPKTAD